MSKQEMLMLSTKDRDRLKILHEVKRKHLTQRAAAQQLGVSDRWVRELLRRVKKEGDRGVVHRGRGRVSNRRLPESVRTKTLKLVQAKYRDFGPTLACEYLAKNHQVEVSKETLRQWLIGAGLRRVKRRKVEEVHVWRPRRSCRGELLQWGTAQDRLVKGLRLAQAASLEEANTYLEQEYLPLWNRSFTVVAANPTDAHRRLSREQDLPAILSHVEERVVTPDYTIRYQGKIYQLGRSDIRAPMRIGRVRVEQRLDGSLAVKFRERYVSTAECQPRPKTPPPPKPVSRPKPRPKAAHNWMKGFDLRKSPPLGAILAAERAPVRRDTG